MACRSISFSEVPQYSDDIPPASSCHHPDHLVWTAQLEQQLQYAQEQLAIAQSNWSEDQEIWINEVGLLLLIMDLAFLVPRRICFYPYTPFLYDK